MAEAVPFQEWGLIRGLLGWLELGVEGSKSMCLAVPGQVKAIFEERGTRMGRVDFGGITKEVCLAYLPDIAVGDYTIVHVGFAISRIDEQSALETLKAFHDLGLLEEEFGVETAS
jgi:hydrogenase expression/formation protein HypC